LFDIGKLKADFQSRFPGAVRVFSAPGRVNLIGEHTDYNDGFVLPMAIERRTFVAAAARPDRRIVAFSKTLGSFAEADLDAPGPPRRGAWVDFVEGTAQALRKRGVDVVGANLLIDSEVPTGAGVSASAALEISVGLALATLAGRPDIDRIELALAGQAAEHEYVGTLSGIMDQYISALGQAGHALLIDCRSLEPTPVPIALQGTSVVVIDTRVKHDLATSEYNKRRAECHQAVELLASALPGIRALRDVSVDDFEQHAALLPYVVKKRARHVVHENARTLAAVKALRSEDLAQFGRLMVESHRSLRDDYQVSSTELDLSVDTALATEGVYGARMTGGGFGGCAVALVADRAIPALEENVKQAFRRRSLGEPEIFATRACPGATEER
jgi:galactokinase